jgi:hypothetical protein
MKNFITTIAEFLKDRAGYFSYKRLLGISCFMTAIIFIYLGKGSDYIISVLLGVSTSAAGIYVFEKKD